MALPGIYYNIPKPPNKSAANRPAAAKRSAEGSKGSDGVGFSDQWRLGSQLYFL